MRAFLTALFLWLIGTGIAQSIGYDPQPALSELRAHHYRLPGAPPHAQFISPHWVASTSGSGVNCATYHQSGVDDGCGDANANGLYWAPAINSTTQPSHLAFGNYARQTPGQIWVYGPDTNHPSIYNMPGLDYPVGSRVLVSNMNDVANWNSQCNATGAINNCSACVYYDGTVSKYSSATWSGVFVNLPVLVCNAASGNYEVRNTNFYSVSTGMCVDLLFDNSSSLGTYTVDDDNWTNSTTGSCSPGPTTLSSMITLGYHIQNTIYVHNVNFDGGATTCCGQNTTAMIGSQTHRGDLFVDYIYAVNIGRSGMGLSFGPGNESACTAANGLTAPGHHLETNFSYMEGFGSLAGDGHAEVSTWNMTYDAVIGGTVAGGVLTVYGNTNTITPGANVYLDGLMGLSYENNVPYGVAITSQLSVSTTWTAGTNGHAGTYQLSNSTFTTPDTAAFNGHITSGSPDTLTLDSTPSHNIIPGSYLHDGVSGILANTLITGLLTGSTTTSGSTFSLSSSGQTVASEAMGQAPGMADATSVVCSEVTDFNIVLWQGWMTASATTTFYGETNNFGNLEYSEVIGNVVISNRSGGAVDNSDYFNWQTTNTTPNYINFTGLGSGCTLGTGVGAGLGCNGPYAGAELNGGGQGLQYPIVTGGSFTGYIASGQLYVTAAGTATIHAGPYVAGGVTIPNGTYVYGAGMNGPAYVASGSGSPYTLGGTYANVGSSGSPVTLYTGAVFAAGCNNFGGGTICPSSNSPWTIAAGLWSGTNGQWINSGLSQAVAEIGHGYIGSFTWQNNFIDPIGVLVPGWAVGGYGVGCDGALTSHIGGNIDISTGSPDNSNSSSPTCASSP